MVRFCARCFRKYVKDSVEEDVGFCTACLGFPENKSIKGKKRKTKTLKSDAQMEISVPSLKYLCIKVILFKYLFDIDCG
jgi:hypothetical protein